jgi:hypothetical protein
MSYADKAVMGGNAYRETEAFKNAYAGGCTTISLPEIEQAIEVTKGIGATSKLAFKPQKESFDDNNPNAPLALVTVSGAQGVELGRWVVSAALSESFGAEVRLRRLAGRYLLQVPGTGQHVV